MDLIAAEGVLQAANVVLAVCAGIFASTLFRHAWTKDSMKAWRLLIFVLILFAVEEILGALRSFGIFSTPYLTHIVPSFILGLLIAALLVQIGIKKRGAA